MSVGELRSPKPSMLMRFGVWLIQRGPKIFPTDAAQVDAFLKDRKPPKRAPLPSKFEQKFDIEHFELEGQQCVTLHPKTGKGTKHILYFHGGGFVQPLVKQHWDLMGAIVERNGASLTAALYDLVPEYPAANADRQADALFAKTNQDWRAQDIALAGDSAGGHMALSLALRQIRNGTEQAGHLILFAPWLDVTMQDPAIAAIEPHDFMLKIAPLRALGKIWAEDRDPASPVCSPLYATQDELAKLPRTRIFTGRHDLFIIDSRTFLDKIRAAGVDAQLYEYEGAPHVFMALAATREAKDVFGLVAEFLRE